MLLIAYRLCVYLKDNFAGMHSLKRNFQLNMGNMINNAYNMLQFCRPLSSSSEGEPVNLAAHS